MLFSLFCISVAIFQLSLYPVSIHVSKFFVQISFVFIHMKIFFKKSERYSTNRIAQQQRVRSLRKRMKIKRDKCHSQMFIQACRNLSEYHKKHSCAQMTHLHSSERNGFLFPFSFLVIYLFLRIQHEGEGGQEMVGNESPRVPLATCLSWLPPNFSQSKFNSRWNEKTFTAMLLRLFSS